MSDEPTERDVEALAKVIRVHSRSESLDAARSVLASDWYAERIAEARREGAADLTKRIEAAACECGGDGVRYTVGADRRCPVHGYGDMTRWRHLRAALRGDA